MLFLLIPWILTFAVCGSYFVDRKAFTADPYFSPQKPNIAADQEGVHHQPSGKLKGLVWSFGLNNPSIQARPIFNQS
jgi:hypothetical protein